MSLILKENYENLIVVDLANGISFVHDNKTGKNYFSNKTIAEACGLKERTIRDHWGKFKELNSNGGNIAVSLKVLNINRPVVFKSFDFFTYVAYRSDKNEAVGVRNYISNAIDEKFNKDEHRNL